MFFSMRSAIRHSTLPRSLADIERQRLAQIGQLCLCQPGKDPGVVHGQLAGLPHEVRQCGGKIHGMLTGARTDFERACAIRERLAQDLQDRAAIALTGLGKRLVHQRT